MIFCNVHLTYIVYSDNIISTHIYSLTYTHIFTLLTGYSSSTVAAQLNVDEKETTELVLELVSVADKNGLRLPREFGFLLKQVSYRHLYIHISYY